MQNGQRRPSGNLSSHGKRVVRVEPVHVSAQHVHHARRARPAAELLQIRCVEAKAVRGAPKAGAQVGGSRGGREQWEVGEKGEPEEHPSRGTERART